MIKILIGFDMLDCQFFDGNLSTGSEISKIDVENVKITEAKIDTGTNTGYNNQIGQSWDYDTVFDCKFTDLNFEAGNLSLNGMPIEYLRIKKCKENQLTWQTYKNIAYDSNETNYTWSDYFVQSLNSYQYAIVPVGANDVQGEYGTASIDCEYEDVWIMGSNNVQYHLIANIEMGDIQYVTESSLITTLGSQFPYRIQNGNLKYRKGSITAMLVSDSTLNSYGTIDRVAEKTLRENFEDFLTNGKPKLFKESEGRYILISIDINTVKITPNNDLSRRIGNVNFEFVEIGDSQNVSDLQSNGILM